MPVPWWKILPWARGMSESVGEKTSEEVRAGLETIYGGKYILKKGWRERCQRQKTKTKQKTQKTSLGKCSYKRMTMTIDHRTLLIELGCQNLRKQRVNTQIPSYTSYGTLQSLTW